MKYLIVLLVLVLGYGLWRNQRRRNHTHGTTGLSTRRGPVHDMVSCTHCQLHLPRTEALSHQGRYYCCAAHQQHQQQHRNPR